MHFTQQIEIDKPIDTVVALYDNPDNLTKWMEGLLSYEHLSGTAGESGAKAKMHFKMGRREIEMVETIITRNLPDEFSGTYEAKGVYNVMKSTFKELSPAKTLYTTENEFQFTGFMKLMGFLMPGAFKKQSMKYMVAFKDFVEKES